MINKAYRTASDIYRAITDSQILKDYTVIIAGKTGPTGKTTLCKLLVNAGVNAIEISETLNHYVQYSKGCDKNDMIVDDWNKTVLVILNRLRSNDN